MRISDNHWLINIPIAHRGLWNSTLPENTLPAYKNAVENGYAIETDLYITTDGVIVCFHDVALNRLTGANGKIYQKSYEELNNLFVSGSNEKIPTFQQLLDCVDGKVPLLIEFKEQPNHKALLNKAIDMLKNYKGEFAVQSFNPAYVSAFRKKAPEFIRGILATDYIDQPTPKIKKIIAKKMPFNFMCMPDFISYRHTGLPVKKRKAKNKRVICWTITNKTQLLKAKKYAENFIFENFIP